MNSQDIRKLLADATPGLWNNDGSTVWKDDEENHFIIAEAVEVADAHLLASAPALAQTAITAMEEVQRLTLQLEVATDAWEDVTRKLDMTIPFPYGSYIIKGNKRLKILGAVGDVRFISEPGCEFYEKTCSVHGIQQDGWTEEKKRKEVYWFVENDGTLENRAWDESVQDFERLTFGNVFKTVEEAQEAAEKIKALLKI